MLSAGRTFVAALLVACAAAPALACDLDKAPSSRWALAAENGVDCIFKKPDPGDAAVQKQIIDDLVNQGVKAIAVSVIDPVNQTGDLNAVAGKVGLLTVDNDAPTSKRLCYIGMNNYDAGRMAGKLVKGAMPEGGSVMIFVGRLGQENARLRRQGVIDQLLDRKHNPKNYDEPGQQLKGSKYVILDTRTDQKFLSFVLSSLWKLMPGLAGLSCKANAVVITAFCSSPVRRARLSMNVSAMRNSIIFGQL